MKAQRLLLLFCCIVLCACHESEARMSIMMLGGGVEGCDCPAGTYRAYWTGDCEGDTDKICINSGNSVDDMNASSGATFGTDYGDSSVGVRFTNRADNYVEWLNTDNRLIDMGASTTIWIKYYHVSDSDTPDEVNNVTLCEAYVDDNNELYTRSNGDTNVGNNYRHGGTLDFSGGAGQQPHDTWQSLGVTWQFAAGSDHCVSINAGVYWECDDDDLVDAGDPDEFRLGEYETDITSESETFYIDTLVILDGYQVACPWC